MGQAIESTAIEGDICARFREMSFTCSPLVSPKGCEKRAQSIAAYLHNYNKLSSKPYDISCSCGYASVRPTAGFGAEHVRELFSLADRQMYLEKERHHAARR